MADAKPKVATPRPTDTGFLHGVRRSFARHHVGEFLKTMIVVAPLTVLIWVYAERSQVTEETAQIALDFRASDPSKLAASVVDPSPLMLELKGPNNQISNLKDEFARRAVSGQLVTTLPANYDKPGEVTIE